MFAKLTSTKATSVRVLQQARPGLRPEPVPSVVHAHANDNRVIRQGFADARRRPALTCRWVTTAEGRLECRWLVADGEAGGPDEPGGLVRSIKRPVAFGGRRVALVGS